MTRTKAKKSSNHKAPKRFDSNHIGGSAIASLLHARIFAPPQALVSMSEDVLVSLNRLIKGTGKQTDWMKVLHRITMGSYSLDTYFKYDQGAHDAFNLAWQALVCIQLRAHLTGELGVLVKELDSITQGLSMTDQMHRMMNVAQVGHMYRTVDAYYEELVRKNMKSYPANWKEVADMEKKLAAEFAEVRELDPLKEAA